MKGHRIWHHTLIQSKKIFQFLGTQFIWCRTWTPEDRTWQNIKFIDQQVVMIKKRTQIEKQYMLWSHAFSAHVQLGGRSISTGNLRHLKQLSHWAHCSCPLKIKLINSRLDGFIQPQPLGGVIRSFRQVSCKEKEQVALHFYTSLESVIGNITFSNYVTLTQLNGQQKYFSFQKPEVPVGHK